MLSLCVAITAGFLQNDNFVNTKGTTLKHVIQTHAVVQGFADAPAQHSLKFCKGKPVHSVTILATPLSSDFGLWLTLTLMLLNYFLLIFFLYCSVFVSLVF